MANDWPAFGVFSCITLSLAFESSLLSFEFEGMSEKFRFHLSYRWSVLYSASVTGQWVKIRDSWGQVHPQRLSLHSRYFSRDSLQVRLLSARRPMPLPG